MNVPLLDLQPQYRQLADDVQRAVLQVVESQSFILGPEVEKLEQSVARHLDVAHAIGCANGTDAILLSLRALDVKPGDEVVTTPFTFFATAGAIHNVGARPVFADIEEGTFNLDPAAAAAAVTDRTAAILPVHLFGQLAPVEAFREIGDRKGIPILEDAAQAIGAKRTLKDGRVVTTGTLGDAATISFFPSKNLGAFGDAGMIVTNHDELADRLRRLRVHGGRKTYYHEEVGYNSRLDALQAAVLSVKLPYLEAWSDGRRKNASFYRDRLADIDGIGLPVVLPENLSIYNQFTLRILDGRRDALKAYLQERGIGTAVYYPLPLHLQECFAYLGYNRGDFPRAEEAADQALSLPIFPELTDEQLDHVARSIRNFFAA